MPKSSTTLKKGQSLPPRGKSNKTRILDAIRKQAMLGLSTGATRDEAEEVFFRHIAERAFMGEHDKDSGTLLKLLADKGWASMKPVMGCVEFDFNPEATPADQARQVLKAVSEGAIPPDIGNQFVQNIASMLKVEEVTELRERLEKIEAMLDERT